VVLELLAGRERTSASKATTRSGHGQYFAAGVGGKGVDVAVQVVTCRKNL